MDTKDLQSLAGQPADIAPFGEVRFWTGFDAHTIEHHRIEPEDGIYAPVDVPEQGGSHIGIEWDVPRQIERVVARFDGEAPGARDTRLQYWNHNWPTAYRGGWTDIDDPHNGGWVTAHGDVEADGDTVTYTFDPLDITELARAEDFAVFYRQTYRFRLLFTDGASRPVRGFEVYSTSTWKESAFSIAMSGSKPLPGGLLIRNGHLIAQSKRGGQISARVLGADCSRQVDAKFVPVPPDLTVVTLRAKPRDVSFAVDDLADGPIDIPDLGVTIRQAGDTRERRTGPKPVFDRILDEPEQSYERASREVPHMVKIRQGRYVPLGCDSNRQEFALRFNGHLFADKRSLKVSGRDTARLLWPGGRIDFKFPTMDPPDFRERDDAAEQSAMNGCLPVYTTRWMDRQVEFVKTDFAALICGGPENEPAKRGDEAVAVFTRVRIRNASEDPIRARFWIVVEEPEALEVRDGAIVAAARIAGERWPWHKEAAKERLTARPYERPRLRALIETHGRGEVSAASCAYPPRGIGSLPNAVAYDVELAPREAHAIELKFPFVTLLTDDELSALRQASFDAKLAEMSGYWERKIASGAKIETPEPVITEFVKATVPHIAITADRDIETGYYLLPAATYNYNVCANEAMHQVRSLDFRGYHKDARKYLMPFVHCQGSRPLHGKFRSQEGVLHGLRVSDEVDYQTFNYNLDHGFVLFALCEHYFLTRDRRWANGVAPNLVAACDMVTREREYTKKLTPQGEKAPEYGLIPPGHLEDNPEWLYWYAVNAYCYRGMAAAAEVLRELGQNDAGRIAADAADYREDLRRSMRLHMEHSPVTALADGRFVPFTPTRAGLLTRDLGWMRNSLYGPIHTIECGVLDASEDQATWILKDSEDNVFVHKYRGRQVDLERYWFSQGGNTIQSGLLPMAMVYIKRDQPEHAVRCLMNSFAQNIYRDVRCFTEHPVEAFGLGVGPFYKTPDESCWVNWLRHCLVSETGDDSLRIGPAIPRTWMQDGQAVRAEGMATYFGPVSFGIESNADSGEIVATVTPPKRNPPKKLEIRLRHPEKKPFRSVTVNGEPCRRVDRKRETIALDPAFGKRLTIVAKY
jgi:hypothetical protein